MASLKSAFSIFKARVQARMHKSLVFRTLFIKYPQIGGGLVSAVKAMGADYFAQTTVDPTAYRRDGFNVRRNLLFALLGFTHGGFINYFVHSFMNPRLFGDSKDPFTIAKIITFNQFVYTPCFAFPVFYSYRGLVYSNGSIVAAKDSLKLYLTQNITKDVMMAAKIWGPAHIVTYTLIPRRYRVYWINLVSFAWTTILSTTRGVVTDDDEEEETAPAVTTATGKAREIATVQINTPKVDRTFENQAAVLIGERPSSNNNNRLNTRQIEINSGNTSGGISADSIDANNSIIDPGNDISPLLKKGTKGTKKEKEKRK